MGTYSGLCGLQLPHSDILHNLGDSTCVGATNLMSQELNAFAIKLPAWICSAGCSFLSSLPLPSTYIPRGASWGKLIYGVPLTKKGGGGE